MPAGFYRLEITQGSKLDETVTYYQDEAGTIPVDLTGYGAEAKCREKYTSADAFLHLTDGVVVVGGNGTITLGGAAGTIRFRANASVTAGLSPFDGSTPDETAVWDLELIPPSGVEDRFQLLRGPCLVHPEATK